METAFPSVKDPKKRVRRASVIVQNRIPGRVTVAVTITIEIGLVELVEDPEIVVVVGACEIVSAGTPEINTENLR